MEYRDATAYYTLAVLVLTIVGMTVFIARFHVTTAGHWRRTPIGRNLMDYAVVVWVLMVLSLARAGFGDWYGRRQVIAVFFTCFCYLVWRRWYLLEQEQRFRRKMILDHAKRAGTSREGDGGNEDLRT